MADEACILLPLEPLKKFGIWDISTGRMVAVVEAEDRQAAQDAHVAAQTAIGTKGAEWRTAIAQEKAE